MADVSKAHSADPETVRALSRHYQHTFELTQEHWNHRNRAFLSLLLVVGVATLLTFNPTKLVAEPLLFNYVADLLGTHESQRGELHENFPYGLIQSILLMVILYFMVTVYHRTTLIQRNYAYLATLERELRARLDLRDDEWGFTREGRFYKTQSPPLTRLLPFANIGMLGVLLGSFLGVRIYVDLSTGAYWIAAADVLLAVPTLVLFGAYAYVSSSLLQRLLSGGRKDPEA